MSTDDARRALELWQEGSRRQMEGDVEGAIDCYRRSIEMQPTAEAHTFLGWALSWQGDIDGAIAECRLAIEVDPEFGNPYNDIGAYLIEKGELTAAVEWLERAKQARRYEPRHFPYMNLARVYAAQGKATQAIRELEVARTLAPGDSAVEGMLAKLRVLN